MIINSKFHDYYDNCVGFGIDKALVFDRKHKQITNSHLCKPGGSDEQTMVAEILAIYSSIINRLPGFSNALYSLAIIGFCGKIYIAVEYDNSTPFYEKGVGWSFKIREGTETFWRLEDVHPDRREKLIRGPRYQLHGSAKSLADWFELTEGMRVIDTYDLFARNDLVSFFTDGTTMHINPELQKYGFQKLMDGVTAFQEISLHLANLTSSKSKEPEPVSDKLKAISKGFDDRSFRKEPGQKRRKKRP